MKKIITLAAWGLLAAAVPVSAQTVYAAFCWYGWCHGSVGR